MQFRARLSLFLRLLALGVLVVSLRLWLRDGARIGWSKFKIEEQRREEITGIDYTVSRDGFAAGVEVPVGGVVVAAGLFGLSLLFRRR